jgi:hypothetical protein
MNLLFGGYTAAEHRWKKYSQGRYRASETASVSNFDDIAQSMQSLGEKFCGVVSRRITYSPFLYDASLRAAGIFKPPLALLLFGGYTAAERR